MKDVRNWSCVRGSSPEEKGRPPGREGRLDKIFESKNVSSYRREGLVPQREKGGRGGKGERKKVCMGKGEVCVFTGENFLEGEKKRKLDLMSKRRGGRERDADEEPRSRWGETFFEKRTDTDCGDQSEERGDSEGLVSGKGYESSREHEKSEENVTLN